jgi:hypothetical protein
MFLALLHMGDELKKALLSASVLVALVAAVAITTAINGSADPTPTETSEVEPAQTSVESICDKDPLVPPEWAEFETRAKQKSGCARPFRYVVDQVVGKPNSLLTQDSTARPFCGIKPNPNFMAGREFGVHLDPQYEIHVVGITDSKNPSTSSPGIDYKKYFDFIKSGFENMTDAPSDYQITFSDGYLEVVEDFSALELGYSNRTEAAQNKLAKQVINLIDPEIDFSKVDKLFIFVPPTISKDVFEHSGTYSGNFRSNEGYVDGPFLGGTFEDYEHPDWTPHGPIGFMHEIFHLAGGVVDDHYGEWQPGSPEYREKGPAPGGTGEWGNMSGILMDWLAWDKYLAQMITDDQVRCANENQESIVWLRPSTHDSTEDKLLLIPIGKTKAIAVESIRSSGFNFKVPSRYHGALVYEIDTSLTDHGLGVKVLRPTYRSGPGWSPSRTAEFDFALADATLKFGEKMSFEEFQIEVLESGEFGDVIRVVFDQAS